MQCLHLESTDSTSSEAVRRLQAGTLAPFAIWADVQTAGRGRRGRQWLSPLGNLYLTLVLPPPLEVDNFGLFPLKAAVIAARLLQAQFGFRVTVKWPNDLLFAGKKLGGILCELSSQGTASGELLIGIGLNLNRPPAAACLQEYGDGYDAIGVAEIIRVAVDVSHLVSTFCETWWHNWRALPLPAVPAALGDFTPDAGALWTDVSVDALARPFWQMSEVNEDGTIMLNDVVNGASRRLSSSDHGLTWVYQGQDGDRQPMLIADIGNSAVKLHFFAHAAAETSTSMLRLPLTAGAITGTPGHIELIKVWLQEQLEPFRRLTSAPAILHVVSVNPTALLELRQLLQPFAVRLSVIAKRHLYSHGPYPLADLGMDRLALIEGVLASPGMSPGRHLLISVGTAMTIDLLDVGGQQHGYHHGGLILPGIKTALHSLHTAAALLPDLAVPATPPAFLTLGHSTATAMCQGVLHACVGAIREVIRCVDDQAQRQVAVRVILTGGDGGLLAGVVPGAFQPELLALGAKAMVRGG